ncbi:RagB/SusD family nutrient uptake outer membrane protein [Sphingobacterium sp. DK4209]|uniref:RagB/SusD family nutrient uptake outer membrane protein n=1 Tax=Sphingobacterium zhuxiongii TaxID=2662364 RepID=A0A5Q0QJ51_9SPHI|nr:MULTISPECIES: RagB/SusD family nutrient uptake outer membrane protein [unclassified Sphingobacterium]MVZ65606.1 RagB/SusD family nutrient uptake outer membrane protein [Sphingobacterium sp. DK4209]QGA27730.1 RagB/SusD family nutrient uptake outer membrane protein [Sphingobacterium sp. dk4302]
MKKFIYASVISLTLGMTSCKKDFLETVPTDKVDAGTILESADKAQIAMNGIYRMLYSSGWSTGNTGQNFGIMSTKLYTSVMGEDLLQDAQGSGWFYFDYKYDVRSRFTATTWRPYATWNFYYTLVSNANYIIGAESTMQGEKEAVDLVIAQALAIRAYAYFQLIQGFQQTYVGHQTSPGVPLYTEPTTSATEGKPRGTVEDVYKLINEDLDRSITLFSSDKGSQSHKSNIDFYVASAMKANVALVQNKWADAAKFATDALSKPGLSMMTGEEIYDGFNSISAKNVMWGAEVIADQSTIYSSWFSHMDAEADRYARSSRKCIYNWLYNQIPASDLRKKWWNGPTDGGTTTTKPYNQVKFRYSDIAADLGDYVFMRAEEMQLVKAEALANDNKLADAKAALEALMKLRNPTGYQTTLGNVVMSKDLKMGSIGAPTTLMDHIILQRRIELWGESERIYDILRLKTGFDRNAGNSNHSFKPVFNTLEPANKEFILTIPQKEFDGNEALDATKDQNPM